jgi:hypothetical protein
MEACFGLGKYPLSKVIAWCIEFPVSHCCLRYTEDDGKWLVHSVESGVIPDWWHCWAQRYNGILRFKARFSCADKALDGVVRKLEHKSYGYVSIIGFGIKELLRKLGINIKNILGDKNTFMCSEVTIEWLKESARLDPSLRLPQFDSENTNPKELISYLRSRPDLFEELKA